MHRLSFALAATLMASACGGMTLYDVTRSRVAECDITPQGEFCTEGGPSVQQLFAVEVREGHTVVYFGDEAWVLTGEEGPKEAIKEERATRSPGPCTTTLRRELSLDIAGPSLSGTLVELSRTEGADACGETPRGRRQSYALTGSVTNQI